VPNDGDQNEHKAQDTEELQNFVAHEPPSWAEASSPASLLSSPLRGSIYRKTCGNVYFFWRIHCSFLVTPAASRLQGPTMATGKARTAADRSRPRRE
jgi:hypothetical protein